MPTKTPPSFPFPVKFGSLEPKEADLRELSILYVDDNMTFAVLGSGEVVKTIQLQDLDGDPTDAPDEATHIVFGPTQTNRYILLDLKYYTKPRIH